MQRTCCPLSSAQIQTKSNCFVDIGHHGYSGNKPAFLCSGEISSTQVGINLWIEKHAVSVQTVKSFPGLSSEALKLLRLERGLQARLRSELFRLCPALLSTSHSGSHLVLPCLCSSHSVYWFDAGIKRILPHPHVCRVSPRTTARGTSRRQPW